ncbi:hypothetical protein HYR99_31445 [Candidatus Poribacteria bacterium]|nr:hypothetical protein [Candidatus Poribacteria bacterium]
MKRLGRCSLTDVVLLVMMVGGVGQAKATPIIYFTTSNSVPRAMVQRVNQDGTNLETLVDLGQMSGRSMAVDPVGGKMYFGTSEGRIFRANLDGSQFELILQKGSTDLELDLLSGKIYFVTQNRQIFRADLDGSNFEIVADFQTALGEIGIVGITLDSLSQTIYFTDTNTNSIYKSNFDGSNLETLIQFSVNVDLEDIEVDPIGGKIYWTDKSTSKLQRANLDGTGIEDLVVGPGFGRQLALDIGAGKVYWSGGLPFRPPIMTH